VFFPPKVEKGPGVIELRYAIPHRFRKTATLPLLLVQGLGAARVLTILLGFAPCIKWRRCACPNFLLSFVNVCSLAIPVYRFLEGRMAQMHSRKGCRAKLKFPCISRKIELCLLISPNLKPLMMDPHLLLANMHSC
jgi:hypothetical protein